IYSGGMAGLLNHRLDRKFDWNTSFWAISARHLAHEGFLKFHGGIYLTAGDMPRQAHNFYAGHPPLTAWMAMAWMRLFGESDAALRSLPLAFSILNIALLYLLIRRVLGGAAAFLAALFYSM